MLSKQIAIDRSFSASLIEILKQNDCKAAGTLTAAWTELQWHTAKFVVQTHGIAPLFYKLCSLSGAYDNFNPAFQGYISEQYYLNQARINKVKGTLQDILEQSSLKSMAVMPLKGALLITNYYEDAALRPMSDIDLLVKPEDLADIGQILHEMGYDLVQDSFHHVQYMIPGKPVSMNGEHPDNPLVIELHKEVNWPIGHLDYDITDLLWQNAENKFLGYDYAFKPSEDNLLMMLACHCARNQYEGQMRAIQLYDLKLVAESFERQNWARLQENVQKGGFDRAIYAALHTTERFLGFATNDVIESGNLINVPGKFKHLIESQSFDTVIADNEYKTLYYRLSSGEGHNNKVMLSLYEYLLNQVRYSNQLQWFEPGRETFRAILDLMKPSQGKKEKWGWFIAYLGSWIITPLALLILSVGGQGLREKILEILRSKLLRQSYYTELLKG